MTGTAINSDFEIKPRRTQPGATKWDTDSYADSRVFIKTQDARFRRAMLLVHPELRSKSQTMLLPPIPAPPKPVEHDWLVIEPSLPPSEPLPPLGPSTPHWKTILREVAHKHGLGMTDLLSTRRQRPVVAARHEAMFRMKTETSMSFPAIGARMGGRDHTTVMNGVIRHELRRARAAQ